MSAALRAPPFEEPDVRLDATRRPPDLPPPTPFAKRGTMRNSIVEPHPNRPRRRSEPTEIRAILDRFLVDLDAPATRTAAAEAQAIRGAQ